MPDIANPLAELLEECRLKGIVLAYSVEPERVVIHHPWMRVELTPARAVTYLRQVCRLMQPGLAAEEA